MVRGRGASGGLECENVEDEDDDGKQKDSDLGQNIGRLHYFASLPFTLPQRVDH